MRTLFKALLAVGFLAFAPENALAQVESVVVGKGHAYIQTGPNAVALDPASNNFGFSADVNGTNIAGITPPVLTGPVNTSLYCCWNNGRLTYSTGDRGWRMGSDANDYGTSSLANLNAAFPNGTYTLTVNGVSVPLLLTGDAYPNAPVLSLSGGAWSDGKYVIDPGQPLTITTNAFTAYGTHADDLICIAIAGGSLPLPFESIAPWGCGFARARQLRSSQVLPSPPPPGWNTLSYTLPANTLVSGQEYLVGAVFQAIVDKKTLAGLPGSTNVAYYDVFTSLTLKAESRVFPMTVTGSIGPTVSNITANIQYRPSDVGTSGSVYSFAVAPASVVRTAKFAGEWPPLAPAKVRAGTKADPVACVLAQLNSSGQLQQVSASTMQAYLTGTLSSQGASINVLNNVSTPNIAGATFYVGYGSSATAMLSNGINQPVVQVPGNVECRPQPPQTGWWWNPAEAGRGFSIEARANRLFMASFLYDESGRATWYVASGPTSLDGSLFTGDLLTCRGGQTLTGPYSGFPNCTKAGSASLAFSDDKRGTLVWPGGSVPIERFNFVTGGVEAPAQANQPQTGWWWNPAESGRGFFIEWQNGTVDIAGYMYDDAGNPLWYIAVYPTPDPRAFSGNWWQFANGQTLTGPLKPATRINDNVGPATIQFTSPTTATMTLPGGRQIPLVRQEF
jgi:hypothetical protein